MKTMNSIIVSPGIPLGDIRDAGRVIAPHHLSTQTHVVVIANPSAMTNTRGQKNVRVEQPEINQKRKRKKKPLPRFFLGTLMLCVLVTITFKYFAVV
ncbi:MAG: hypothetical protein JSU09_18065 [Bacteroidetes bacterium]|nr:hypothetical protein [Bacteroidota bacterium]